MHFSDSSKLVCQLWELACARNIGMSSIPIVCVNIDGYYDPFRVMLQRAWNDKLTKLRPEQIMHFADTAEEAIQWIEEVQGSRPEDQVGSTKTKGGKEMLRLSSVMGVPSSADPSSGSGGMLNATYLFGVSCIFAAGVVAGIVLTKKTR